MFRFGLAAAPSKAGAAVAAPGAWPATLPPGARFSVPLPSIWNGAKVLLSGAVLTPKMSLNRSFPVGEIKFCEGTVPTGSVMVEFGIGANDPSELMEKPTIVGASVPGLTAVA